MEDSSKEKADVNILTSVRNSLLSITQNDKPGYVVE